MASVGELIAYAKAKQKPDPFAQIAEIALGGTNVGYQSYQDQKERVRKAQQQKFENELKLIDAADKIESIRQKQYSNRLMSDVMKAVGVEPLDQAEKDLGRQVAGEFLGDGKTVKTDNTMQGRITDIFENKKFGKYDLEVTAGPTGASIKIGTKKDKNARTAGEQDRLHENTYKMAKEMARREYIERLSTEIDPASGQPYFVPGITNPNTIEPPAELIDKWVGYANKFNIGDYYGASSERRRNMADAIPLPIGKEEPGFLSTAADTIGRLLGRGGK